MFLIPPSFSTILYFFYQPHCFIAFISAHLPFLPSPYTFFHPCFPPILCLLSLSHLPAADDRDLQIIPGCQCVYSPVCIALPLPLSPPHCSRNAPRRCTHRFTSPSLIQAQQLFAIHTFCQNTQTWLFLNQRGGDTSGLRWWCWHDVVPCSPLTGVFIVIQQVFYCVGRKWCDSCEELCCKYSNTAGHGIVVPSFLKSWFKATVEVGWFIFILYNFRCSLIEFLHV